MLTSRGWWFLLVVVALLGLALLANPGHTYRGGLARDDFWTRRPNIGLALLGLTLALWFAWEWLLFTIRARIVTRRLEMRRQVRDSRGPVDTLWAGRTFEVRVELRLLEGLFGLP